VPLTHASVRALDKIVPRDDLTDPPQQICHNPSIFMTINQIYSKIPSKKWGHTKIAEQGRSLLVMRARYRKTVLTPHQRGWTDAGWTVSRL